MRKDATGAVAGGVGFVRHSRHFGVGSCGSPDKRSLLLVLSYGRLCTSEKDDMIIGGYWVTLDD